MSTTLLKAVSALLLGFALSASASAQDKPKVHFVTSNNNWINAGSRIQKSMTKTCGSQVEFASMDDAKWFVLPTEGGVIVSYKGNPVAALHTWTIGGVAKHVCEVITNAR